MIYLYDIILCVWNRLHCNKLLSSSSVKPVTTKTCRISRKKKTNNNFVNHVQRVFKVLIDGGILFTKIQDELGFPLD